ncbi:MAG TPA: type II secretion system protein [Candidatus Saccharimonadales bacterium]|nr:type II secretion system protein [Candidatus Saccharimonadales bacterium]
MLSKTNKRQNGFTIIEVLIVLAIAGLIMLIVFLAVPALQRNARNNQRSRDVSALLGGMSEYVNNNNGSLPVAVTSLGSGTSATIGSGTGINTVPVSLSYYDASKISITTTTGTANPNDAEKIIIVEGATCSGPDATGGPTRGYVALYTLENSSKQCKSS